MATRDSTSRYPRRPDRPSTVRRASCRRAGRSPAPSRSAPSAATPILSSAMSPSRRSGRPETGQMNAVSKQPLGKDRSFLTRRWTTNGNEVSLVSNVVDPGLLEQCAQRGVRIAHDFDPGVGDGGAFGWRLHSPIDEERGRVTDFGYVGARLAGDENRLLH